MSEEAENLEPIKLEEAINSIVRQIHALSSVDRETFFNEMHSHFCKYCGSTNTNCYCWE